MSNIIRLDSKVRQEVDRVDMIMSELTGKPSWMMQFSVGHSDSEVRNGLKRLSEGLRFSHLEAQEATDSLYNGVTELFERCDTKEARANNIAEIEKFVWKRKQTRLDAEEGIFYEPQLTDFDPTRYRVLKQLLGKWKRLLPVKTVAVGATETKYTMWESTGRTNKSSPGKMTGVNYAGVKNERFTNKIVTSSLGYQYTTDDLRKAAYSGEPLVDELLIASMNMVAIELDDTAWNGDAARGLFGAINHPGVPNIQAILDGGTRSWSDLNKSNDAVFSDINNGVGQIAVNSGEQWTAENTEFNMIIDRLTKQNMNRRMAAGTDTTLLSFIRNNVDASIRSIEVVPDIAGSGPAGSNQALIYPFDSKVIRYRVNETILWGPMQWVDLMIKFAGEIIHGGVEIIYAVAMIEIYDI